MAKTKEDRKRREIFPDELEQIRQSPVVDVTPNKPGSAPPAPPKPKEPPIQAYTDEQGRTSGIVKNGKSYLGGPPDLLNEALNKEMGKRPPVAVPMVSQVAAQNQAGMDAMASQQQFLDSLNAPLNLQNLTPDELDKRQAALSALRERLPSVVTTGAGGAIAGSMIAGGTAGSIVPGWGTAIGAGIGLLAGFVGAYQSSLKEQARGNVKAGAVTLSKAQTDLSKDIALVKAGGDRAMAIEHFNRRMSDIQTQYQKLRVTTDSDVNKYLGEDGTIELQRYYEFYRPGGARDYYMQQMQLALASPPNPQEAFMFIDMEELQQYGTENQASPY